MKVQTAILLVLSLLSVWSTSAGQEILCPSSGLPVSQDPGCWARESAKTNAAQQAQQQQQALPPRPTGYWEKTWGAIAPSPVGGVLGTSLGASSKEEAERLALKDCTSKGGKACEVEIAYQNQCAVMVTGKANYRFASAASIPEASQLGIQLCKERGDDSCSVYYSACTEPIFHKY
ncbi:DUF4189 domain-containing protein [Lysobacter sp. M15]|uniref:DUF4189 domain-containing protein n=1 Tax=Lysobacter sp. M15 TaxID=2916837 RepID=UPI001F58285C|nr:DUF4189 domain-containing protein [Lysobacter sp. M15]